MFEGFLPWQQMCFPKTLPAVPEMLDVFQPVSPFQAQASGQRSRAKVLHQAVGQHLAEMAAFERWRSCKSQHAYNLLG